MYSININFAPTLLLLYYMQRCDRKHTWIYTYRRQASAYKSRFEFDGNKTVFTKMTSRS